MLFKFLLKSFSISGRVGRAEYIWHGLLNFLILVVVVVLPRSFYQTGPSTDMPEWHIAVLITFFLLMCISDLSLCARRFQDLDQSPTRTFLLLIPIVGFVLGIYLLGASGTKGPNQYGEDPNELIRSGEAPGVGGYILNAAFLLMVIFLPDILGDLFNLEKTMESKALEKNKVVESETESSFENEEELAVMNNVISDEINIAKSEDNIPIERKVMVQDKIELYDVCIMRAMKDREFYKIAKVFNVSSTSVTYAISNDEFESKSLAKAAATSGALYKKDFFADMKVATRDSFFAIEFEEVLRIEY